MGLRAAVLVTAFGVVACASSGGGTTSVSVPIYMNEADVPCAFEVIETIEGSAILPAPAQFGAYQRERTRVLSREGGRVGADAVFLPPTANPVLGPDFLPLAGEVEFFGYAIRYLPGTCRGR